MGIEEGVYVKMAPGYKIFDGNIIRMVMRLLESP